MNSLPREIIEHILDFLDNRDWGRCQRVCRRWRRATLVGKIAERRKRVEWCGKTLPRFDVARLRVGIVGVVGHRYAGKSTLVAELANARSLSALPIHFLVSKNAGLVANLGSRCGMNAERDFSRLLLRADTSPRGLFLYDDLKENHALHRIGIHRTRYNHLSIWTSVFVDHLPMLLWTNADYLFLRPGRLERHISLIWSKLFAYQDETKMSLAAFRQLLDRCRTKNRWLVIDVNALLLGGEDDALFIY